MTLAKPTLRAAVLPTSIAAIAALGAPAHADVTDNWYAGASYQFIGGDLGVQSYDVDALALRGGYNFTGNFGAEVEGAVGLSEQTVTGTGSPPVAADIKLGTSIAGYGVGRIRATDYAEVYIRAGYAQYTVDRTISRFDFSDDFSGLAWGGGIDLLFGDHHGIRLGYTDYGGDETAGAFDIGYNYRF